MERLTIKTEKGAALKMADNYESESEVKQDLMKRYLVAVNRLAAYEDTGLEPEEVLTAKENAEVACALNLLKEYQSVGSVEHFRELSQAEHDGRLVVRPVKNGDKIFRLFGGKIQDLLVSHVIYRSFGGDACRILVECIPFHRSYWREDFGKTIFLTREEAEAALKNSKRREI